MSLDTAKVSRTCFVDIVHARFTDWPNLNRVALGYVHERCEHWAILSTWRHDLDGVANLARFDKLEKALRSEGVGFHTLLGHFRGGTQSSIRSEPALFVSGILEARLAQVALEHDVELALFGDRKQVPVLSRAGTRHLGPFHAGLIVQTVSEARATKSTCVGFDRPAQSYMEGMTQSAIYRLHPGEPLPRQSIATGPRAP